MRLSRSAPKTMPKTMPMLAAARTMYSSSLNIKVKVGLGSESSAESHALSSKSPCCVSEGCGVAAVPSGVGGGV